MMEHYQRLNPLALAVASACTALIAPLLIGFPVMSKGRTPEGSSQPPTSG